MILSETRRAKLLLVDDDQHLASALRRSFTAAGLHVSVAHTLNDARRLLQEKSFDAVVLDLCLGDTDGLDLLREWPGDRALPPTIVLSAHVGVGETVTCVRAGAVHVLEKPTTPSQVLSVLERSTAGAPFSPQQGLLGSDASMRSLRAAIVRLAGYPSTSVLLCGETGTGKSAAARALHAATDGTRPFVTVNCPAIPEALFESELFGSERGAFTGARKRHVGLMEQAGEGTLFLDEVTEMSPSVQPKLLRALETREFRRVGGKEPIPLRARLVSATNHLKPEFRIDLYHRLAGFTMTIVPLRERPDDIELLAVHFLSEFAARHPACPKRCTRSALELLRGHSWPGNVRELKSVMAQAAVACESSYDVSADAVGAILRGGPTWQECERPQRPAPSARKVSYPELERDTILSAFEASKRNVSATARSVGLPRTTVRDKLHRYGVM